MLDIIFQETKHLEGRKKRKSSHNREDFDSVPGAGVEPAQPCGHWCLRPARLPIPPSGQTVVAANVWIFAQLYKFALAQA